MYTVSLFISKNGVFQAPKHFQCYTYKTIIWTLVNTDSSRCLKDTIFWKEIKCTFIMPEDRPFHNEAWGNVLVRRDQCSKWATNWNKSTWGIIDLDGLKYYARSFTARATGLASPSSNKRNCFGAVVECASSIRHCRRERAGPRDEEVKVQEWLGFVTTRTKHSSTAFGGQSPMSDWPANVNQSLTVQTVFLTRGDNLES